MPDTFSSTNIVDFYYLEAMMDRAKRLPETPLPSQEKWKSDLERQYRPFVTGFAASIRDYLFLTCVGEARHALPYAQKYFPELGDSSGSRMAAYERSIDYTPSKNIDKLSLLFNQIGWKEPGYGGTKWATVASAVRLYGKVPDPVFIDVVVSIEHNNGNVFNKTDVKNVIPFECHMGFYDSIREFLRYKFRRDILRQPAHQKWLSRETLSLLQRYYHVVSRKDAPRELLIRLAGRPRPLPKDYESPWGEQVLGEPQWSPESEEGYEQEEETEEKYAQYQSSVSATPKMPRGE